MNISESKSQTVKEIVWLVLLTLIIAYFTSDFCYKLPTDYFTEGDFGRDIYNFYLVSKGNLPYVDFNWIYGPLSLILYGMVFKLFGPSIQNAVIFWNILFIINIYLLYFFVRSFSHSTLSFLAGLSLLFFYGFPILIFNHVLGVTFVLISLYFVFKFLKTEKNIFIYLLCLSSIFLVLTKQNIGVMFSSTVYLLLIISDMVNKKNFSKILISFLVFLVSIGIIYFIFYSSLPSDQIAKNFLYGSQTVQNVGIPFPQRFFHFDTSLVFFNFLKETLLLNLYFIYFMNLWYLLIPIFSIILGIIIILKEKKLTADSIFLIILACTALVNSHEFYIVSTSYSLRFWVLPIILIIIFYSFNYIYKTWKDNKFVYYPLFVVSIFYFSAILFQVYNFNLHSNIFATYLPYKRAQVSYIHPQWLSFVIQSVNYINKNTKPGDKILTLPYNALYNFLSERDMPARDTEFEYMSNISPKDQQKVIQSLEINKVKIIMISHKAGPISQGIGVFGKTHCQQLYDYINKNYYVDIIYSPKGKSISATTIYFLKRKTPFNP